MPAPAPQLLNSVSYTLDLMECGHDSDIYAAHYWLDRDLHAQIANQYHDVQIPAKFSYRILLG